MANLLQDLEGKLEQSANIETSITNHLRYYFNFNRDTSYEKRIQTEISLFFKEKKGNKNYFTPEGSNTKLKPANFNNIMQFFLKRLWDEENFNGILKLPATLSFINEGTANVKNAKVTLEDIQKHTSNFKLFPFIPPEKNFFSMQLSEQVKVCSDWIKNGNKLSSLLERFKLMGGFVQTMYFLGQNLVKLSEDLDSGKGLATPPEEITQDSIEQRAGILTQVIMNHPLTRGGYLKFSEGTLRRSLAISAGQNLSKEGISLKYIYSILTPARSMGVADKDIALAANKILEDFKIAAFSEKKEENKAESLVNFKEFARYIDMILFEVRAIIRANEEPARMRTSIRSLSDISAQSVPGITERHITLIYLFLKDIFRPGRAFTNREVVETYQAVSEKFKIPAQEAKSIFFLIESENVESLKEPLSSFIDKYSKEEKKELTDKQIEMLKSIMGNFPKEITVNQFHSIKEKLKLKVEDESKRTMIDTISKPIEQRIADIRFIHMESKLKEKA